MFLEGGWELGGVSGGAEAVVVILSFLMGVLATAVHDITTLRSNESTV